MSKGMINWLVVLLVVAGAFKAGREYEASKGGSIGTVLVVDGQVQKPLADHSIDYRDLTVAIGEKIPDVEIGSMQTLPEFGWVQVQNRQGVANKNSHHAFNDTCSVERGGSVRAVGQDQTLVLVEYFPPTPDPGGAKCGKGTRFYLDKNLFPYLNQRYEEIIRDEEEAKAKAERMAR